MTSIQQTLDNMLKRSLTLCGTTHEITAEGGVKIVASDAAVRTFLSALRDLEPDPKKQAETIIAAWDDKSGNIQRTLNAARIEQVSNFIMADSVFRSAFFENASLGPQDQAFVENTTNNEVRITAVGEDGTPEQVRVVKPGSHYGVGIYFVSSDIVKYKTLDVYKGDVSNLAKGTIDIARDVRIKVDRIHYNLLGLTPANGGCYGAFSYEQTLSNKTKRIYVPHSVIDTSHFPTTNDIDLSASTGGGTETHFGIKTLKNIKNYGFLWGNVFDGGALVPTGEIIVPASDIIAIADDWTPTANTASQGQGRGIQDQVNQNGYATIEYLGINWKFIADVTIPKGTCYPRFNLLPGLSWDKPSLDREQVETNLMENWETRQQRKAYSAVIISQRRIRACRIKYI